MTPPSSPSALREELLQEAECQCDVLRPPTERENEWLQEHSLQWRSKMPPDTKSFDGIGELNYAFYIGDYITKIWWRNEDFQCKIYFIKGSPFPCEHDSSLRSRAASLPE